MELHLLNKEELTALYQNEMTADFPHAELKPLRAMLRLMDMGRYDPLLVMENGESIGYALLWLPENREGALLEYFGVLRGLRNGGLGTKILTLLAERCGQLFGEAECPSSDDPAENELRRRRIAFYERNGFRVLDYECALFGVHFNCLYRGPETDDRKVEAMHRGVYAGYFSPAHMERYIQLPLKPGEEIRPAPEWVEEAFPALVDYDESREAEAVRLIQGFWLAHNRYHQTEEEAKADLCAWTGEGHKLYFVNLVDATVGLLHLGSRGGKIDWLEDLFILPEYQGRGVGGQVIRLAENMVKQYSESMYIEAAARNERAIRLYRRLGFDCLNTVTIRKDFPGYDYDVVRTEQVYGQSFEIRKDKEIGMQVVLGSRTAETAAVYFERTNHASIRKFLPQKAKTVEEAVADFYASQLPGASSYGRSIWTAGPDGRYVGDVWCYCIDPAGTPNAMVSYCVFEQALWGQGAASRALELFLLEIVRKYGLKTVGAFTFSENLPSIRVLEKNGFRLVEEFVEDGVSSKYFQLDLLCEKG